jgi:hypothetical protein
MNKVSNVKRVMEIANTYPDGFTTVDVRKQIKGINLSSMHALLWTLKNKGVLTHDKVSGVYKLATAPAPAPAADVSTPVNKKRLQSSGDAVYEREIRNLTFRVRQLNEHTKNLQTQIDDALAIIRYLEDKLFKAIQFDARNGSNT